MNVKCHRCRREGGLEFFDKHIVLGITRYYALCRNCRQSIKKEDRVAARKRASLYYYANRKRILSYVKMEEFHERSRIYGRGQGKEKKRNAVRRRRIMHRLAVQANGKVAWAIKKGTLIRESCCAACGKEGEMHAHHEDYRSPYMVVWLCYKCHLKRHEQIKRQGIVLHSTEEA